MDSASIRAKKATRLLNASKPNLDAMLRNYPNSRLSMSGLDVGLPAGQMGNSEVGHMILGAGRIVFQDLTLIHKDIDEGKFYHNQVLLEALRKTKAVKSGSISWGLLGDGGVHSHQRHMEAILEMAQREKVGQVYLHLFLDGRDTPPTSAEQFMLDLNEKLKAFPNVKIATVSGRYYAMDRDKRWDRVEKAYLCLTEGIGNKAASALAAIRDSYKEKITDEFVLPTAIDGVGAGRFDPRRRRRHFFQLPRRSGARIDPGADRRGFQGIFAQAAHRAGELYHDDPVRRDL